MTCEMPDAFETLIERPESPSGTFPLLREMYVERGSQSDWELLHELHYKTEGSVFGPHYWRCALRGETIGVIVLSMPRGLLAPRHAVFPNLKPGKDTKLTNTYRYKWVNANIRLVSRLVVDTMFRGVGVAYRLQNLASRMEGIRFVEIQSSMSKYNLFAQKAGFRFAKPMRSQKYEVGLAFFRGHFESNPADHEAIMLELDAMSPTIRERTIKEMREFYFKHSAMEKTGNNRKLGTARVDEMPVDKLLKNLQQMVLASPMYGVYQNPDYGRQLPDRLPLTAFDNQAPNEPLRLDLL